MKTENRQVYSVYGMIFMLGGLWAAFALSVPFPYYPKGMKEYV